MSETKQTDNADKEGKLALRLCFLREHHIDDARVFDCCQGSGLVWKAVRKKFTVKSYWGVDKKTKSGRVTIDSVRILNAGVSENVIDVDTYGEPWEHWLALLPHVKIPTTVFMTIGSVNPLSMSNVVKKVVFGRSLKMPPTLYAKLWDYAIETLLNAPHTHGLRVVDAREVESTNKTRHVGIHIVPENV